MEREYKVTDRYMWFPVWKEQEPVEMSILCGEKQIYGFRMTKACADEPDFYAAVNLSDYSGDTICVKSEDDGEFFSRIRMAAVRPERAEEHPVIHFAADNGWINDPNGLYYQNETYHMFFQHNPFDVKWGNMSWGHAVSSDLLHWQEQDPVLYPDAWGTVFSGCAVVDEKGKTGLPANTPVLLYTACGNTSVWSEGKKTVQKAAYSRNGGRSFVRVDKPVIENIDDVNRDPKVYWSDEINAYYMVLYIKDYEFAVLNSDNLKDWVITQRFEAPFCQECPDLRLISSDKGTKQWVFWSADGLYFTCSFNGREISQRSEVRKAYLNEIPYAAQTFANVKGRVITVPWLRTENTGGSYRGVMGIPMELELSGTGAQAVLRQVPVREFRQNTCIKQYLSCTTAITADKAAAVYMEIERREKGGSAPISFKIYDADYSYDPVSGIFSTGNSSVFIGENLECIWLLADRGVAEIWTEYGKSYGAVESSGRDVCGNIIGKNLDGYDVRVSIIR